METKHDTMATEHSDVVVFPPVIPLTGFLLGVALQWLYPIGTAIEATRRVGFLDAGIVVLALGAAGFAWMVVTMKRAGTPIHNSATPTMLVERGPFRWTRNPMYLFGSVAYAGLALLIFEPWSLLLLPLVLVLTHFGVVLREEAFLERRFGDAYRAYTHRVRRWL